MDFSVVRISSKSGRPRKIIRDAKFAPQKAVPTKSGLVDAHYREEPASEGRLYKSKKKTKNTG